MKKFGSEIFNEDNFEKFPEIGFRDQMGERWQNQLNSFRVEKLDNKEEVGKGGFGDDEGESDGRKGIMFLHF